MKGQSIKSGRAVLNDDPPRMDPLKEGWIDFHQLVDQSSLTRGTEKMRTGLVTTSNEPFSVSLGER